MLELAGFAVTMIVVAIILGVVFLLGVKLLAKGGKAAASGAGNLLDQAEHAVESVAGGIVVSVKRMTHGQLLDKAEALVAELTSGGYLTEADGQSIVTKIATGLTTHKAPAAPVTEATAAA